MRGMYDMICVQVKQTDIEIISFEIVIRFLQFILITLEYSQLLLSILCLIVFLLIKKNDKK